MLDKTRLISDKSTSAMHGSPSLAPERWNTLDNADLALGPTPQTSTAACASNALQAKLQHLYAPIVRPLAQAEQHMANELASKIEIVSQLCTRAQGYGGKRLRPALVLLAGGAVGDLNDDHPVIAAVVEMIHLATLVHDDVLDDADVRRHHQTVHAQWGNESSVLLGDYLFTHAFHLAASLESTVACRLIGRATNRVCEGELLQVSRRGAFDLSRDEYFQMIEGKTASLISCCTRLGAQFAGADAPMIEQLSAYGRHLGLAFQLADDVLDLTGDADAMGKQPGNDWDHQKATLPLIRLREVGRPELVSQVQDAFEADTSLSRADLLQWLAQTDALDHTQSQASHQADLALQQLQSLPPSPFRERLEHLAHLSARRPA